MIFEISNQDVFALRDKIREQVLREPFGSTVAILDVKNFVQGCRDEVTIAHYPIGGIVTRRRTYLDKLSLSSPSPLLTESNKLVDLHPHQVAAGIQLDIDAAHQVMDSLSKMGIWQLPHTAGINLDNRRAEVAISDGQQTHTLTIHSPSRIYHQLIAYMLNLVQLPSYSL